METYPLQSLTIEEAKKLQFKAVSCMMQFFQGAESLSRGDLGVVPGLNKPVTTQKAEMAIARLFDAEACMLVRGAGSGAIRLGLHSMLSPGDAILVHKAPIYSTTATSLKMLGICPVEADFHNPEEMTRIIQEHPEIKAALVQYTRQKADDHYEMEEVIGTIHHAKEDIPILTDDNYAVMKVKKIGTQHGADLSCFSSFKLLGPEGVGIIVGKKRYIDMLIQENYSGGMQVQGHEAMDVLHGLIYAPVMLAIQAEVNDACVRRLNSGEISQVKNAFLANAQSKVLLVEFYEEIADRVLEKAEQLGAAPNPVGAESKYEMVPMFYRVSGTFRKADPTLEKRMIRINPMRAGADTIIDLIKQAVE